LPILTSDILQLQKASCVVKTQQHSFVHKNSYIHINTSIENLLAIIFFLLVRDKK
jgi:hypothetical protein